MKISTFKTDEKKERDGVWVTVGEGARLLIGRVNGPRYRNVFAELIKPYRSQMRNGTLAEEEADRILLDTMAETVLLGWEGIEDDDGNEVPYSSDKAREFLEIRDFRVMVEEFATERELFRQKDREEAGKG